MIRTRHLISGDDYFYITDQQPDMEHIEVIKEKAGDKRLKFLVIDNTTADTYYDYLKDNFSKKYGQEMADYLLANLHQDGLLSIGRSYLVGNAQMTQQDMIKTANASIDIRKGPEDSVTVLESIDVENILVMGDEGPEPLSRKEGPVATLTTQSSLTLTEKGVNCQIDAMTIQGQSSMNIKHKLEACSKPGPWPGVDTKSKAAP